MSASKAALQANDKKAKTPVPASPRKSNSWSGIITNGPSLSRSTSRISLSKFKNRRCQEKLSFKRALLDDESDSGFDSANSQSNFFGRRQSGVNPFFRDESTSDATLFEVGPSTTPLISVEGSSLVDRLKRQDVKDAWHANSQDPCDATQVVAHPVRLSQPVPSKKAYIPYKDYFDWSLKTKLRLTLSSDLKWISSLTPQDRVKRIRPTKADSQSYGTRFMQLMQYYIFPFLNGVKTFPRQAVFSMEASIDWQKVMPDLQKEWSTSLMDLSDSLLHGECPFFYIVSHQWIALVLSRKLDQNDQCRAYIVPTSRGFRDMLDVHGIAFRMPLRPSDDALAADRSTDELDTSTDSEKLGQGGMNIQWIKDTCLSVGKIIDTGNKHAQENAVDFHPESIVALDGAEVETFLTTLAKERSLQPSGGLLMNVPPTLIAPVTFLNATSKKLEFSTGRFNGISFLEISEGPIMPHFIPALSELLRDKHADLASASAIYSSLDNSAALARVTVPEEKPDHEIQPDLNQVMMEDAVPIQKLTSKKPSSTAAFDNRYANVMVNMTSHRYL